jgi:hypothetical protein
MMKNDKKSNTFAVRITYSSLWGHALQATKLARMIEHCFDIPVKPEKKDDGFFEVTINGETVYKEQGNCDPNRTPDFLLTILQNYKDQVRILDITTPPTDKDDPKHSEWMRSVCSGE